MATLLVGSDVRWQRLRGFAASHRTLLTVCAAALLAAVFTVWSVMHLQRYAPDDAFITYRVADHLASGQGWSYNVGEETGNAATSPLYTGLLALGALVYSDIPRLGTAAFIGGILLAAICTFLLLRRVATPAAAWLSVPFITLNPWLASTRGMESGLFLGLTSATLLSVAAGRLFLAGALAGATTLVRGEGILLCVILGVYAIATLRRVPWRLIAGGVSVIGPWVVYSAIALGSVLPDTLAAKVAQGRSGYWGEGYIFLGGWIPLITADAALRNWGIALGLLAAVGVAHWALYRGVHASLLMLTAFAVGFVAMYGLVFDVPGYHWYYSLPVYWTTVLAAIGAGHLLRSGVAQRDSLHLVIALLATGMVIASGWAGFLQGWNGSDYVALGEWLQADSSPGDRIAASEIGYIGWTTERPIVDYLGLLSPESTEEIAERDVLTWIEREDVDYWVRFDPPIPVEAQLASQTWFSHAFERVHERNNLGVYERVRSNDDARVQAQEALVRDARAVLARLSDAGIPDDRDTAVALAPLLQAVAEHQDLFNNFVQDGQLRLSALLEWGMADPDRSASDPRQVALAEHHDAYAALGSAIGPDEEVPVSSVTAFQTDLLRWWQTGDWEVTDG